METLARDATALGLALNAAQLQAFATYYDELVSWNQRINLTSITDRQQVQTRHFLDSLTVLLAFPDSPALAATCGAGLTLLDIGAGAGFPGLPLGIVCPQLSVTLLEATNKKTDFLRHVVTTLGLKNVDVVNGRAEDKASEPNMRERYDIVVARAVARLATLAELCLPFNKMGGRTIAMKSADVQDEVTEARRAIGTMGGALREVLTVDLAEVPDKRTLVVLDKVSPTPPKYPRRSGMPGKRPL